MPQSTLPVAVVRAWMNLVKAQRRVLGAVETDLRRAGFPPLSWYDILLALRGADGKMLRPVEIEGRLLLAQHNVSRLIDRLERDGLIRRQSCSVDGRGQMVVITPAGHDLLRRMWPAYRTAIQRHVGAKLGGNKNAKILQRLLERLIDVEI